MPCLTCSIDEPVLRYDGFHIKKSNKLQWVYNHSMVTISNRLEISHGHSRKTAGSWGHTFLKRPGIFQFFTLSLEIPVKNKAPPRQILQDCVTSLGNSMAKNHQAPPCKSQIPHYFFLFTPGNSACYFFDTPGDSIYSSPDHWSPILT